MICRWVNVLNCTAGVWPTPLLRLHLTSCIQGVAHEQVCQGAVRRIATEGDSFFSLSLCLQSPSKMKWNVCFLQAKCDFSITPVKPFWKPMRLAVISPSELAAVNACPMLRLCNRVLAAGVSSRIWCPCALSSALLVVSASALSMLAFIQRAPQYVRAALWRRRHRWMLAAGRDARAHTHTHPALPSRYTPRTQYHPQLLWRSDIILGARNKGWSPGRSIPQRAWRLLRMTHGDAWLKGGS